MEFRANNIAKEVRTAFIATRVASDPSMFSTITRAATGAIRDGGAEMKRMGRSNIGAAGFSSKWQNAWRVNVYPKKGYALDGAAFGFHKIPYSLIFESGGSIRGKRGLLWLPLPTVPKVGRRRASARVLAQRGVKLFSLPRAGKSPLLATRLRLSGPQRANLGKQPLTLAKLRRGTAGKRGAVVSVPLFYGLRAVTLRKRFDLQGVAEAVSARLPDLYLANLE